MKPWNLTSVEDFLLVGFSDLPHLQVPLFAAFLLFYLITLVGNLLIIDTIYSDTHLQTPMYFFLTNLSFIDIAYTSVIFPPMLVHFFQEGIHFTLTGCLLQTYFFMVMVSTEFFLLTVMAYDRYVAICNPLRYTTIINRGVCLRLVAGCLLLSLIDAIPHTTVISRFSFCESHTINHFFCDVTALMKLSCTSTHTLETMSYIMGTLIAVTLFILIITSYVSIISSILKIRSTEGRRKAFSTCASHLTVVILFFGSVCVMYMRPTSTYSLQYNKILSFTYIAVTPVCNPIIYSLKNAELKNALRKKMVIHNKLLILKTVHYYHNDAT